MSSAVNSRATTGVLVALALSLAGVFGVALKPAVYAVAPARPLSEAIPRAFGDWQTVNSSLTQVDPTITRAGETSLNQPYDDILMRVYQNRRGDQVMLSVAYGREQRQEVKIHRPELCYTAQGFTISTLRDVEIHVVDRQARPLEGKRMAAVRGPHAGGYTELVSYWIRVGNVYSDSAWGTRLHILREGLAGRVPDGVLVRASRIVQKGAVPDDIHANLEAFLAELVAASPPDARRLLVH